MARGGRSANVAREAAEDEEDGDAAAASSEGAPPGACGARRTHTPSAAALSSAKWSAARQPPPVWPRDGGCIGRSLQRCSGSRPEARAGSRSSGRVDGAAEGCGGGPSVSKKPGRSKASRTTVPSSAATVAVWNPPVLASSPAASGAMRHVAALTASEPPRRPSGAGGCVGRAAKPTLLPTPLPLPPLR